MQRVIIIGAGASGLMTALNISKDYEVIILDKNKTIAKKLLQTGAGKCNFWNEEITLNKYNTNNPQLLKEIINKDNQEHVLALFNEIGIIPKIKNGYFYPSSENAQTIKSAFLNSLGENVTIKDDFFVTDIKKENDKFFVFSKTTNLTCDKLVIATGSNASLKEPSFVAYNFLQQTNHNIRELLPALVGLRINDKALKSLAGLRIDVNLSLYENSQKKKIESGQLQLTSYGLSGICTFNMSSIVARGLYNKKKEFIEINFLPFLPTTDYLEFFNKRNILMHKPEAKNLFETLLNYKLVNILFTLEKIPSSTKWEDLSISKQKSLIERFTNYKVEVIGTNSLLEAQTTTGGVSLEDINIKTMASKHLKNLYITGEILDVDGLCGGFNLAFAFITGYLAGQAITGDFYVKN